MKGLTTGQQATLTRTFMAEDAAAYRQLSGDHGLFGPDPTIVPGPLLAGLFSCLLGTQLPGRGTNWLKQSLAFPHPAHLNHPVTATVTITRLRPDKNLVNLQTTCTSQGEIVCTGEALVLVQDMAGAVRSEQ
jgi:3-hydroxybutyryl-CoA dehydratase